MDMRSPKISIIMGVYNCAGYVGISIDSVLNQSYDNWEFIICDDASTDNTFDVICSYKKKCPDKIRILRNKKNLGLNKTLNKCLRYAKGEYIARQDGDDLSTPDRLLKQLSFLERHKKYALVSSNMIFFDESGEWGRTFKKSNPQKNDFMDGNLFAHGPCMTYKKIYDELNGYSTNSATLRVEDYDLWARMYAKGYKGYIMSDCLYKMRNDKEAIKRRTLQNRINEVRLKRRIFKMFRIECKYAYKIYTPLVKWLLPDFVYRKAYMKRYSSK